jgi:hypothetical protein
LPHGHDHGSHHITKIFNRFYFDRLSLQTARHASQFVAEARLEAFPEPVRRGRLVIFPVPGVKYTGPLLVEFVQKTQVIAATLGCGRPGID